MVIVKRLFHYWIRLKIKKTFDERLIPDSSAELTARQQVETDLEEETKKQQQTQQNLLMTK